VGGLMPLDVALVLGRMLAEAAVVPQHPVHPGGGLGGYRDVAVVRDGGAIWGEGGAASLPERQHAIVGKGRGVRFC
jgi:hypothetical protein